MKKLIPLAISALLLSGCGQAAPESTEPEYKFGIDDTFIYKELDGDYVFIVAYVYQNNSNKPQPFQLACKDSVFKSGIECQPTFDEYNFYSAYVDTAQINDEIMSGNAVKVYAGYTLKDFNPQAKYDFTVRLSDRSKTDDVFIEKTVNSADIEIREEKE